jgi:tetratricopeptide (TPR) repeat protein
MYLNIAACNLKTQDFETAFEACNEALKLDPYSIKALYRRGRSKSLPINSGVEDFRLALADMKRIIELDSNHVPAQRELKKLQKLIDVNRKREKETYSKMFNSKKSISDYVEEKTLKETINYKSMEDKEFEKEK